MAAAHHEASLAILNGCGAHEQDQRAFKQLLGNITVASSLGTWLLAADSQLQAAVATCLARLSQAREAEVLLRGRCDILPLA